MFILDTNVVSELRKSKAGKANRGVSAWASVTPAIHLYLSVISLHELEHGVLLAEPYLSAETTAGGRPARTWRVPALLLTS